MNFKTIKVIRRRGEGEKVEGITYSIEKSKDGYDVVKIKDKNKNTEVYATSKYNVSRDIENLLNNLEKNKNVPVIFIFGLSNGEYLDSINQLKLSGRIYIIDYFQELIDIQKTKVNKNYDNIEIYSFENLEDGEIYLEDNEAVTINYGNYGKIFEDNIKKAKYNIHKLLINAQLSKNTIKLFSLSWISNAISNIKHMIDSRCINDYKNKYKDMPAVIVSAGPSLEKELKILKQYEKKFIIISGGRTLPTLKNRDIKVDFTCIIDAGIESYNVIKEGLNYKTNIIYSEIINKEILNNYYGEKTYYPADCFEKTFSSMLNMKLDSLVSGGGSVAHTCTELARYLGCNPIIFLGQDLAFTNDRIHSQEAIINENNSATEYDTFVEDVYGGVVGTSFPLDSYRIQLERYIHVYKKRENYLEFINCSDGGAKIKGTNFEKFEDVVKRVKRDINSIKISKEINWIDKNHIISVLTEIKKEALDVKKICNGAIKKYKCLKLSFYNNKSNVNRILKELDDIDMKLKEKELGLDIVWSLIYEVTEDIIKNTNKEIEEKEKDILKSVVSDGLRINNALIEAMDKIIPLVEVTLNQLEINNT